MSKIVLDVNLKPILLDNDILVYDTKRKCFVNQDKSTFLYDLIQTNVKLNEDIEKLRLDNQKMRQELSQMAKIIKERVL